jgi:ATP-dependent protease Clp ATPase subunit
MSSDEPPMAQKALRCSFCGKREDQVKKLVAGAKAVICDECVAIADRIMKSSQDDGADPARPKPPTWRAPSK